MFINPIDELVFENKKDPLFPEENMTSLTYGYLPSFEAFEAAFDDKCPIGPVGHYYGILLGKSDSRACDGYMLGNGQWNCAGLYNALKEITSDEESGHNTEALDVVASILETLGFEWI